ncbi:sugar phosphate isomerase/epimerase [Arsukibacterium sp.]|uniref:sugar phosphate isomerase/epimerase family protein n=1 Tax=Arsukibacterium sp. TaxID=1977258 RepID=UPI001BD5EF23|nr:sugar phosphate isomerase/epimerase [Arsukibacterium sp.]
MKTRFYQDNSESMPCDKVNLRRRYFLKLLAGSGLMISPLLAGSLAFANANANTNGMAKVKPNVKPGIQLYTVRDLMLQDVRSSLQLLAELGYQELEFAGLFDRPAARIASWLTELELSAPSGHVMLQPLLHDTNQVLAEAHTLGHRYLVMPYLSEHERSEGLLSYQKLAEQLNRIGEQCQAAGITLAYHNHDFEFAVFDNTRPYDILLSQTDARLVKMEIDFYWAAKMQVDVPALFQRYPGRFPLWHMKDMTADGNFADLGKGTIDFGPVVAAAGIAGLQHAFVERDNTDNLDLTLQQGIRGFKKIFI